MHHHRSNAIRFFAGISSVVAIVIMVASPALSLDNGVARTPPMGWNTFNAFGGSWTAATLRLAADSLVKTGLKDCGYVYVNADGNDDGNTPFWPARTGFVAWAKPIADDIHAKGLKFGVYTSELANPTQVASDLVAAGVDFLKVDAWMTPVSNSGWTAMRDALVSSGRPIVFSSHNGDRTLNPAIANMARTGRDIEAEWPIIMEDYNSNYGNLASVGPGAWADPDMLETGCRADAGYVLTAQENRSHFTMWCMMAAPLLIGYDVTRTGSSSSAALHATTIATLSNTEVIAVDQDALGKPGKRIKTSSQVEVWIKELKDGTKAVAFFNIGGATASASITKEELGFGTASQIFVRDLWTHASVTPFTASFSKSVEKHAAEIFRMGTSAIEPPVEILEKMEKSVQWLAGNGIQVYPSRTALTVLCDGNRSRAFDLRGRSLVSIPSPASGAYVLRSSASDRRAGKIAWTGK